MILFDKKARQKLEQGVNTLANAVKVTLGAKGRNAILDNGYSLPVVTKDGVSVARFIELEDRFENIGARLVKEVASKTNTDAGDGTTTATVLAQAMINYGMKLLDKYNPLDIKRGMDFAVDMVVNELRQESINVVGDKIKQIASISANDEEIGTIVANAIIEVGENGVITIEDNNKYGYALNVVKGMQFDRGFVSQYMVTNEEKQSCEYDNPLILITDRKINTPQEIVSILEKVAPTKRSLVIVSDEIENQALSMLVINKVKGIFNSLAVRAPGFGESRKDLLQDIAIATNGTVISEDNGIDFENFTLEHLGTCEKIISTKDLTIMKGIEQGDKIQERISQLKGLMESANQFEKDKIKQRIAKLSSGVAVIKVGVASEVESKEIKDRIEDAINATRAGIIEGVVVGGGVALYRISKRIKNNYFDLSSGEKAGFHLVLEAIKKPMKQIGINAGRDIKLPEEWNIGYNAKTDTYENLVEAGVIDPVKVVRLALQNACSVASMFLTTEVVITKE